MNAINIEELNPNITQTVLRLRSYGFETTDSGDGETHDYDCDRDYPYVVMRLPPSAVVGLRQACNVLARIVETEFVTTIGPVGCDGAWIQGDYDPSNNIAMITLAGVTDDMLKENIGDFEKFCADHGIAPDGGPLETLRRVVSQNERFRGRFEGMKAEITALTGQLNEAREWVRKEKGAGE